MRSSTGRTEIAPGEFFQTKDRGEVVPADQGRELVQKMQQLKGKSNVRKMHIGLKLQDYGQGCCPNRGRQLVQKCISSDGSLTR